MVPFAEDMSAQLALADAETRRLDIEKKAKDCRSQLAPEKLTTNLRGFLMPSVKLVPKASR